MLIDKNSEGVFKNNQSSAEHFPKRVPKASAHPKNIPNGIWDSEKFQKCPLQKILWRFAEVEGMKGLRAFYSLPDSRFWKFCYGPFMTLLEIQKAAESLSIEVKRSLMIFLLRRLLDDNAYLLTIFRSSFIRNCSRGGLQIKIVSWRRLQKIQFILMVCFSILKKSNHPQTQTNTASRGE